MDGLSRRDFIGGAGAAAVAPAVAAADGLRPQFVRTANGLELPLGSSKKWSLPDKGLSGDGQWTTSGQIATYSGKLPLGRNFRLDLALHETHGDWTIVADWDIAEGKVRARSKPVRLARIDSEPLPAELKQAALAALTSPLAGKTLGLPASAILGLDKDLRLTLDAQSSHFSVFQGQLKFRRLALAPLDGMAAQLADTIAQQRIAIGANRTSKLHVDTGKAPRIGFRSDGALEMVGALRFGTVDEDGRTTHIPCRSTRLQLEGAVRKWRLSPVEKPWRLRTPHVSFDVCSEVGQVPPIEIAARNGVVESFDGKVHIHGSSIALPDVDSSRFDFGGVELKLRVDHEHSGEYGLALSDIDAPFRIKLSESTPLRVWRGRDLMHLTFRFRDLDLVLGGKPRLEPSAADAKNAAPQPTLSVEFPPQHVLERSFLRQTREAPDAGEPTSPALIRELKRLAPRSARAKEMRTRIAEEKEKREFDDIVGAKNANESDANYNARKDQASLPFAEFRKAWAKTRVKKGEVLEKAPAGAADSFAALYGDWIGPVGLFSLAERRRARLLVRALHESQREELIGQSGEFSTAQMTKASELYGLPAFPLTVRKAANEIRDTIDPAGSKSLQDIVAILFDKASGADPEFRTVHEARPAGTDFFILPNWPFSASDWDTVLPRFVDQNKKEPPIVDRLASQLTGRQVTETLKRLLVKQRELEGDTGKSAKEGFDRPVEAWLSDPSWLAFDVSKAGPLALTAAHLTDWSETGKFQLKVVKRAQRYKPKKDAGSAKPKGDATSYKVEDLLDFQDLKGADGGQTATGALDAIEKTLVQQEKYFDTAVEAMTGLVLSPAEDATWETPGPTWGDPVPDKWGQPVPLWRARLREAKGRPSLRAIWASKFEANVLDKFRSSSAPDAWAEQWTAPDGKKYRTAMSPRDRSELVLLTSMYGLPVVAVPDKEQSSQVAMTDRHKIIGLDSKQVEQAIYMPTPLRARRLALGSTGIQLDLDTSFPAITPVSLAFTGFSLARWRALVTDGTDEIVTVVRRGYLFPLGHNAALIKVTEPRIRPIDPKKPGLGYTVEQATRLFIEVTQPRRTYPAVEQFYGARDFQAREITLLTPRTPDLIDPADDIQPLEPGATNEPLRVRRHGAIQGWVERTFTEKNQTTRKPTGRLAGMVFWPRTAPGPNGTVRFRMRVDDGATPVTMPLIFVDHAAASDSETMRALCERYYNQQDASSLRSGPPNWSTVLHNGAVRTYADEERKGQCSFVTDWQRFEAVGGSTSFAIDGSLAAATQAPFYPRMAEAQIRPQQLQELTGSPPPPMRVQYARDYVLKGFARSDKPVDEKNADGKRATPAERAAAQAAAVRQDIYLVVSDDPKPILDMGKNGDRGGTVARKSMTIFGFNRRFGIAGEPVDAAPDANPKPAAPLASQQALVTTPAAAMPPAPAAAVVTAAAASAKLAPMTAASPAPAACEAPAPTEQKYGPDVLFKQIGSAKLFGLIDIVDFLKALAGAAAEAVAPQIEEISTVAAGGLTTIRDELHGPIIKLRDTLKDYHGDQVFPDLTASVQNLECAVAVIPDKPTSSGDVAQLGNVLEPYTQIWTSGRQVARALDAIAHTPIADIAGRLREQITGFAQQLTDGIPKIDSLKEDLEKKVGQLVTEAGAVVIALDLPESLIPDAATRQALTERFKQIVADVKTWRSSAPLQAIADALVDEADLKMAVALAIANMRERLDDHIKEAQKSINEAVGAAKDKIRADANDKIAAALTTAGLPADLSLKVANAFIESIDPDPQKVADKLLKSPAGDPALRRYIRDLLLRNIAPGQRYAQFKPVFDRLAALQANSSPKDVAGLVFASLLEMFGLAGTLAELSKSATAKCDAAVAQFWALSSSLAAIVTATGPGSARTKFETAVKSARADLKSARDKLDTAKDAPSATPASSLAAARMSTYVGRCQVALDAAAAHVAITIARVETAAKNLQGAIAATPSCANFTPAAVGAASAFLAAQRDVNDAFRNLVQNWPKPDLISAEDLAQQWQDVGNILLTMMTQAAATQLDLTLASLDPMEWSKLKARVEKVASDLKALPGGLFDRLAPNFADAVVAIEQARADVATLKAWLKNPAVAPLKGPDDALRQVLGVYNIASINCLQSLAKLNEGQQQVLDSIGRFAASQLGPIGDLNTWARPIATPVAVVYDAIIQARTTFAANASGLKKVLSDLFVSDGAPHDLVLETLYLNYASGDYATEDDLTRERPIPATATFAELNALAAKWRGNEAAPQRILLQIETFGRRLLQSTLVQLFDIDEIRKKIEDAIASVLPTKRSLKSNLTARMSKVDIAGFAVFTPLEEGDKTLSLKSEMTFNLLEPTAPTMSFTGNVGAFQLDIVSILSFYFRQGVKYTKNTATGDSGTIKAQLGAEDIKFGDKLSFLADLAGYFSFGDKENGPYSILHVDRPAIEAGYRIAIPVITLGVTFTNIHFAGAVILPFDKESARVRAALGSLDAPFMISVGIYGGTGFMGLEASPAGIEAFEASFEFGGVASLGYGPLQGTAYVTTGAYVRKDKEKGCTFAALFSAGFTAHIAWFGVSAAFTLRLMKSEGDSSVRGEGKLTFTFSIGWAKISYTIRVARNMEAGFGGGGRSASDIGSPRGRVQLAALGGFVPDCGPPEQKAWLYVDSRSPQVDWSAYQAQFDPHFRPRFENE